jgi:hypothetical protein
MGIGLISVTVGLTMVVRSQSSEISATAQKMTGQATAITEGAIARALSILNHGNNGVFKSKTYDPINPDTGKTYLSKANQQVGGWENTTIETNIKDGGCSGTNNNTSSSLPVPIPSNLLQGTMDVNANYKLLAYQYQATNATQGKGTMLMEGTQGNAKTRLQVSLDVTKEAKPIDGTFPGLYMEKIINLGNNDIIASSEDPVAIICKDCQMSDTTTFCPPTDENILKGAMGGQNNAVLTNVTPKLGNPQIPPLPLASGNEIIISGTINDNLTLPKSGDVANTVDTATGGPVFEYKISSISLSGSKTLTINTNPGSPNNPNGYPVHLYVTGNISVSGQAKIDHIGDFGKFAIFGKPDDGTAAYSQTFVISGGATSKMFVYAPDANVGINGGSGDGDITGVVWAEVWNASNSNNADLIVPKDASQALKDYLFGVSWTNPQLTTTIYKNTAPLTWERVSVSAN